MKKLQLLIIFLLTATSVVFSQVSQKEFEALKVFYEETNGDKWLNNSGWDFSLGAENVSQDWYGLLLFKGSVFEIDLSNNNLSGKIPVNIGDLYKMQRLTLFNNNLEGGIPKSVFTISSLTILELGKNHLSGEIPKEVANSVHLFSIGLVGNDFSGGLSPILRLNELCFVDLKFNNFSFAELEYFVPQFTFCQGYNRFYYSNQKLKDKFKTVKVKKGSKLYLNKQQKGKHNKYQWYKDEKEIKGAKAPFYIRKNATKKDAGSYTCQITNTKCPKLKIMSAEITVKVE